MKYRNKNWLFNEYVTLRKTQSQIAKECNVPICTIEYWISKFNLVFSRTKEKYVVDESRFDLSDPIFCYFAGLIATDGYISTRKDLHTYRVCLRMKKSEDLERLFKCLNSYFGSTCPLFYYNRKSQCETVELRITSNFLVSKLMQLGIPLKDKTFYLKFPKNLNEKCLNMYLRGVLDGDGSLSKKNNGIRFRLCTASVDFIKSVQKYLQNRYKVNISYYLQSQKYPSICFEKKEVFVFLKDIYNKFEDFKLMYKYNIYYDIVRPLEKSKELENKESLR